MKLSTRQHLFLLASGTILAAALLQWLAVAPLQKQRAFLAADIQDAQNKSAMLDEQISTLLQNSQRRNPLSEAGLSEVLLTKESSIELITRVENLATAYHVESAILFSGDIDPKKKGVQEIPTTIRSKGAFDDLVRFTRAIEQEPFYISAESIRLVPALSSATGEQTIEMTINAKTTWK